MTLISMILCLSLVVICQFSGQVSLAPLAFADFAALMTSVFASDHEILFPWAGLLWCSSSGAAQYPPRDTGF